MSKNRKINLLILFLSFFSLFFILNCKGQGERKDLGARELSCPKGFELVIVDKVIDGDTVVLKDGEKLRYAAINALELHTDSGIPEPFAQEAFIKNKELTEGKALCLEKALRERDRYGRLLGELYYPNGTSISELLIKEGLAFVCYYEGSGKFFEKLLSVQREALSDPKNLFSYIDKPQGKTIYIGNRKSRRFHHPQCIEAKRIKTKIIFKELKEALWEGYCPSRECSSLIFSY